MADYIRLFRETVESMLADITASQRVPIDRVAQKIVRCAREGKRSYAYGPGHAGIFAEEMFYRAGGLAIVNPVMPSGTLLRTRPVTLTSDLECLPGYGTAVFESIGAQPGELLIIHSFFARNPVVVEMAMRAREKGLTVAGIVSMDHAARVASRDPSGKMLQDVCDIVIDTCGCYGDACLNMERAKMRAAPVSTIACAFIANYIVIRVCEIFLKSGEQPPVFMSANVDGGREFNDNLLQKYRNLIRYME